MTSPSSLERHGCVERLLGITFELFMLLFYTGSFFPDCHRRLSKGAWAWRGTFWHWAWNRYLMLCSFHKIKLYSSESLPCFHPFRAFPLKSALQFLLFSPTFWVPPLFYDTHSKTKWSANFLWFSRFQVWGSKTGTEVKLQRECSMKPIISDFIVILETSLLKQYHQYPCGRVNMWATMFAHFTFWWVYS